MNAIILDSLKFLQNNTRKLTAGTAILFSTQPPKDGGGKFFPQLPNFRRVQVAEEDAMEITHAQELKLESTELNIQGSVGVLEFLTLLP